MSQTITEYHREKLAAARNSDLLREGIVTAMTDMGGSSIATIVEWLRQSCYSKPINFVTRRDQASVVRSILNRMNKEGQVTIYIGLGANGHGEARHFELATR